MWPASLVVSSWHFTFAEFADRGLPLDQFPALRAFPEYSLNLAQRPCKIEENEEWRKQRAEQTPAGNSPPSVGGKKTAGNAARNNDQE